MKVGKRKEEKAAKKLESDFTYYQKQKFNFDNMECRNSAEKFQQHYYLLKTKIALEHR